MPELPLKSENCESDSFFAAKFIFRWQDLFSEWMISQQICLEQLWDNNVHDVLVTEVNYGTVKDELIPRYPCKGPFTSSDCDVAATSLPNLIYCFGVVLLHQAFATNFAVAGESLCNWFGSDVAGCKCALRRHHSVTHRRNFSDGVKDPPHTNEVVGTFCIVKEGRIMWMGRAVAIHFSIFLHYTRPCSFSNCLRRVVCRDQCSPTLQTPRNIS